MAIAFLRKTIGGWRLELKCLLLLGLALGASMLLAFSVFQAVATRLVLETTRQTARDMARTHIFGEHVEVYSNFDQADSTSVTVLRGLREDMLASDITFELIKPDEEQRDFEDLAGVFPQSSIDRDLIQQIAEALRKSEVPGEPPSSSARTAEDASPLNALAGPDQSDSLFKERGPVGDFYYYYHPVEFKQSCLHCHAPKLHPGEIIATNETPIRILRVKMPYAETKLWKIWSYSIMSAVGLATLALCLFFMHWILRRIVIRPLHHLREISDDVSNGDLSLRSEIDTGDEFRDLSESFNRMLRHLIDTQVEVRNVNSELDKRVDQLAQLNLQLYEANRLKSDFLANMSHELRTPLNSILGFSEVLQSFDTLTDKQKRYAANIQKSGRLLLDMINDILDLAKVEAGKMEVRVSRFDLASLIEGQCDVVRRLAEDKNIDLQVDFSRIEPVGSIEANLETPAAGEQEWINGLRFPVEQDQAKIQQVLINLLSNAIKFTPQGGIITVSLSVVADDEFQMTVTDTGVGIALQDHEAVFEKFRQVHVANDSDSLTREYSGTGLGLSIVRELCRLLGGEISLQSRLGKGSAFTVTLPRRYRKNIDPAEEGVERGLSDSSSATVKFSYP
jgi:signal transduction histidine kinase